MAKANKGFKLGKFWLPPSAEDLKGLIYSMIPGGAEGNKALEFFDQALFRPFSKAIAQFNKEKIAAIDSIKELSKKFDLEKEVVDGLTADQAVRIYIWKETGTEIDTDVISQEKQDAAIKYVNETKGVKGLVGKIFKNTNYAYDNFENDSWHAGSLQGDVHGYFNEVRRKELLEEWNTNRKAIFNDENKRKLAVTHGESFVKTLENILDRQASGRNRKLSADPNTNRLLDWNKQCFWNYNVLKHEISCFTDVIYSELPI